MHKEAANAIILHPADLLAQNIRIQFIIPGPKWDRLLFGGQVFPVMKKGLHKISSLSRE
jgi:hypothetical protein